MNDPLRVAAVGVTGYAGFELARLLLRHPSIHQSTFYLRETHGARCLTELFPQLRGWGEAPCRPLSAKAIAASGATVAFLSTPVEVSLDIAPELIDAGMRVIDLSGGFRFHDPDVFSQWYQQAAARRDLVESAVYGLPELNGTREKLRHARIVANPGCYATSVILGLRPIVEAGWLDARRGIVCDCKSGASGAGKEARRETSFVEVNENFRAYGVFTHRHSPEITEKLELDPHDVIFTTHLLPIDRGILSTISVWMSEAHSSEEVEALYRRRYAGWPMVRVSSAGRLPEVQDVAHTNFCDVGFAVDPSGRRLVIVSCLDNLGKGAAGQAVQNMNEMVADQHAGVAGFGPEAGLL